MLKLIPISEDINSKNKTSISIDELEYFGYLASTLSPLESLSIIDGYINSLWEYMQEIKYQKKDLFNKYDKLIHAENGIIILKTVIELFLMEKEMRINGITEINKYNNTQKYYLKLINDLEE
jgi:hypothetical protein